MAIPHPGKVGRVTRPSLDARQFQTHQQLLVRTSARNNASLDAIIVPASRPAVNLDHAVTLARALHCYLVVLCSLEARAADVNELLALRNFTQAIIVDLPKGYTHPKLDFVTSKLTSLDLPVNCVNPNVDLSAKRNVGLLLARMLGWERIFFMDDDIRDLDSCDLREIASMLGPYRAVGMRAVDFPDNSVVCHGHRRTGGYQDVFISGSVLGVHCAEPITFFPEIYNEDWFFFYHTAAARRLGQHSRDATQLCYDPFADPQRAAGQEFGDVMAEGLYGLLHRRIGMDHATSDYWQAFLDSRKSFLKAVLARSERIEPYLRRRIVSSIETALACAQLIKPSMCERYIALWQRDLATWEQRLTEIPRMSSVKAVLCALDLMPSKQHPYVLAGIIGGRDDGISADATGGTAPLIRSDLALSAARRTAEIDAVRRSGAIIDSGITLSVAGSLRSAGPRVGATSRGVISRMGRRAGELALRAIVAEEPANSADASPRREAGRLAAGRHRKLPAADPTAPPRSIEPGYAGHRDHSELVAEPLDSPRAAELSVAGQLRIDSIVANTSARIQTPPDMVG